MASEQFAAFSPDTLAEARNRGYRPDTSIRQAAADGLIGSPVVRPDGRRLEAGGEVVGGEAEPGLERAVGQRRLRRHRRRIVGEAVEVDPRRAAAVLLAQRHRDRLGEPVRAQREHPQRVALLPLEARRRVVAGPDELAVDLGEVVGIGELGDADDVGPALDADRPVGRRIAARSRRSSGGTRAARARAPGARRWGRATRAWIAARSGGPPRGSRPCGGRGSARRRAGRARRPPTPSAPV